MNELNKEFEKLKSKVENCKRCELHKSRTKVVFGSGNPNSKIMFVGEAPGRNEDLQGKPFVGRAGEFLNELLRSVGLEREEIFITNILKCRPPNNRDPLEDEIKACSPYLEKQLEIIKPKVIVTLGNYATRFFMKKFSLPIEPISKIHGRKFRIKNLFYDLTIIPMYHPAAALYNPQLKEILMEDFKVLKDIKTP